jgi:hypothetical protein
MAGRRGLRKSRQASGSRIIEALPDRLVGSGMIWLRPSSRFEA